MAKKKIFKDLSTMEKIKKIIKYSMNILGIIGALITGINAIDGITIPYAYQIVQVIAVIEGVIGFYLTGDKAANVIIAKKEK